MSVFKPRLTWHSQEVSKISLAKVQLRKACRVSVSPLLLSKTDRANCQSHSLVISFFSINELRHSCLQWDCKLICATSAMSLTHYTEIRDIPPSTPWLTSSSTLLRFDCEESLRCLWNAFYDLPILGRKNSARPLSPRLTFFIVCRWVSSINILILQVNFV